MFFKKTTTIVFSNLLQETIWAFLVLVCAWVAVKEPMRRKIQIGGWAWAQIDNSWQFCLQWTSPKYMGLTSTSPKTRPWKCNYWYTSSSRLPHGFSNRTGRMRTHVIRRVKPIQFDYGWPSIDRLLFPADFVKWASVIWPRTNIFLFFFKLIKYF